MTLKTCLADSGRDVQQITGQAARLFLQHRRLLLALMSLTALLAWAILPYEMAWLATLQNDPEQLFKPLARQLSFWGDWYIGTLLLAGVCWLGGLWSGRDFIRRAALGFLLAALLAGLFGDIFRYGLGRARPNAGVADGLYGPTLSAKFHSFPSGHTTTAFGTAVALAVIYPPVAVPSVMLAGGVAWSRLYLNAHHPSDILMGCVLGSSFGVVFGLATRRVQNRARKQSRSSTR